MYTQTLFPYKKILNIDQQQLGAVIHPFLGKTKHQDLGSENIINKFRDI